MRFDAFIENPDRFQIILLVERANTYGSLRFKPIRIPRQSVFEVWDGLLRAAQILQCDTGIKGYLGVAGLEFQSFRIILPSFVEAAQFQLEISACGEDFSHTAAALDSDLQ